MSNQSRRTLQQTFTTLPPDAVLAAAVRFFAGRNGIYAAFLEKQGPTHVNLRGQGGEEIVIGVAPDETQGTRVTGSTYMFDQQVARFFATLPPFPTEGAPASADGADVSDAANDVDTATRAAS